MSEQKFSRHRRGMRFKPKGGLGNNNAQKADREAVQARAEVVSEQGGNERLFEKRHTHEIERAENIAAGVPETPEVAPEPDTRAFREPNLETPAEVQEEKTFAPVTVPEQPKGLIETIKVAATSLVRRVQRLIRP